MSPEGAGPVPYWRLSGFYFFYFAALGAFLPYWALYLQSLGYGHVEIGLLIALLPATKVISPNVWGWLADRTDRSVLLIRLSSWLTAVSFAMFLGFSGYGVLVVISLLMGFFWNAPLPLFEAVTLAHLRAHPGRYSRVRLWGSIGFIASVTLLGWALDHWLLIDCLPQAILILFLIMAVVPLSLRECSVRGRGDGEGSFRKILSNPQVIAFFAVFTLVQVAHGPYYTFFSVYLKDNGYSGSETGLLWTLGVIAEILLFLVLDWLLRRFRLRQILMMAMLLGSLRWALIAWFVRDLGLLVFAQMLHAATFGVTHVAAIQLVHKHFYGAHQGKGQALYSSLSYGAGGMVGSYLSGVGWDRYGPGMVFTAAAVISTLALVIVWGWVDKPVRPLGKA